jgi:ABC-type dipeptide/oligopeptide/nickel transport system permease subunit
LITLVIGFAAISWVSLARLIRINVLQVKPQLFVEAAIGIGATPWRIITRHLLPNVLHVLVVWIIINIPAIILLEAMLGYIGVGVTSAVDGSEFTTVSWGGIFFSGRSMLSSNPLMLVIPSLCILLLSMSFILLGDVLNETARQ